jgi:cell wall-associated NlpC family hydrolase
MVWSMSTPTSFRLAHRTAFAVAMITLAACWPAARAADASDSSAEIVVQALALLGVPYRWGGSDPARGLDCSGLVQHVFKSVVALDLPRQAEEMSRLGKRVLRRDLRAGDLLFFNTRGHPNSHVALYLGDGHFVHAPGRNGFVRVDGLDDRYWSGRFDGARRIGASQQPMRLVAQARGAPAPRVWQESDFPEGP